MSKKYITGPEDKRNHEHRCRDKFVYKGRNYQVEHNARGYTPHEESVLEDLQAFFGKRTGKLELERMQRPEKPIAECIDNLLKKRIQSRRGFCFETFKTQWPSIVGAVVARHAFPDSLREGTLLIEVDNSAALYSYENYMKDEILNKIKSEAKAVRNIRFIPANRNVWREKKRH